MTAMKVPDNISSQKSQPNEDPFGFIESEKTLKEDAASN